GSGAPRQRTSEPSATRACATTCPTSSCSTSTRTAGSTPSPPTGTAPTGTASSAASKSTDHGGNDMPRMAREEWYDVARDVDWTFTYVDDEAVFPEWLSGTGKVPRDAWSKWDEPYKVSYPDYVATQREKEAGTYSVKAALQRSKVFETLDEGWKSVAKAHFG